LKIQEVFSILSAGLIPIPMKNNTLTRLIAALLFFSGIVACKKSLDSNTPVGTNNPPPKDTTTTPVADTSKRTVSYPQQPSSKCPNAPDYGDSIIFVQPGSNYTVVPINHPDTGTYFAWPVGMVIDKNTGAINVSKSETGLRYNIGYVKKGTADTCMQTLILAGISYEDSLYVLANDERYAEPYYNADPQQAPVCSGSGVPGGGSCVFDVNGQANSQGVTIDKNTGIIDLKSTASKAFGLLPLNGTTVQTTIAYKLNDNSNMALQQITVQLIYYTRKSDVPPSLLAAVTDKLAKIVNQLLLINIPTTGSQQTFSGSPRPPIIIVTRYAN
jgi:hypothetical protein